MDNNPSSTGQNQQPAPSQDSGMNTVTSPSVQTTDSKQQTKPKMAGWQKILIIAGGVAVVGIVLVVSILLIVSATSKKFDCNSDYGNITIMYGDSTINGYTATGDLDYNLDEQKAYAERVGIEAYLDEFSDWFSTNTGGTCTKH